MLWSDVPRRSELSPAVFVATAVLVAIAAAALLHMGRPLLCTCGTIKLWYGANNGPETSQHLTDPYTFTHLIHGALLYGAMWLVGRLRGNPVPLGASFLIAVTVECGWELIENAPVVLDRYRNTAALGYAGDTVLNSISDIVAMAIGFAVAARLPAMATVLVVLAIECGLALIYRDNLLLNVIMLLHPFESLKAWQLGA